MVTLVSAGLPVGVILPFAGAIADIPSGFLHCDGSTINRNDFSALFAAIGTAWGYGDQATTFELPDLRGRFLRGQNDASGNDPDAAGRTAIQTGGNTGDNVGSLQADEVKSHFHGIKQVNYAYDGGSLWSNSGAIENTNPTDNPPRPAETYNAGGNESRPKNAYVNYIIKY